MPSPNDPEPSLEPTEDVPSADGSSVPETPPPPLAQQIRLITRRRTIE